jgi:hypothetical protein
VYLPTGPGRIARPARNRGMGDTTLTPSQVQALVTQYANQYGVDPALALAVAKTESGFNPNAVSPAGAIGTMQLMPSTAASLGVDPNNPTQNIQGGVEYLSRLLAQYGGDPAMALWAYNAGPGRVAAGVMPAETQNYIPTVMASMNQFSGAGSSPAPSGVPAPSGTWQDLVNVISGGDGSSGGVTAADSTGLDSTSFYIGLGLLAGTLVLNSLS